MLEEDVVENRRRALAHAVELAAMRNQCATTSEVLADAERLLKFLNAEVA